MNHRDESCHKAKHKSKASYESQHGMFYMGYHSLFHGLTEPQLNIDESHLNAHIYRAEGAESLIVLLNE